VPLLCRVYARVRCKSKNLRMGQSHFRAGWLSASHPLAIVVEGSFRSSKGRLSVRKFALDDSRQNCQCIIEGRPASEDGSSFWCRRRFVSPQSKRKTEPSDSVMEGGCWTVVPHQKRRAFVESAPCNGTIRHVGIASSHVHVAPTPLRMDSQCARLA
jgi:hypothetical protein